MAGTNSVDKFASSSRLDLSKTKSPEPERPLNNPPTVDGYVARDGLSWGEKMERATCSLF